VLEPAESPAQQSAPTARTGGMLLLAAALRTSPELLDAIERIDGSTPLPQEVRRAALERLWAVFRLEKFL